ncbi:MAG TPA: DUF983 domain-containing protein [Pseudonocardiaceae bacterium]|nr:DUF983 domain-containing protein [Pseudonocardiaceae bacterium]
MMRVVRAADRRSWTIRSRISWTKPALADQFEHDMAGGYVSGIALLGVLVVMVLFVVVWKPGNVVIPSWFSLLFLLVLLLIPLVWAMQRPWIITASTPQSGGRDEEYWEGIVRGMVPAREEAYHIAEDLASKGVPDDVRGPLQRRPPPGSYRES